MKRKTEKEKDNYRNKTLREERGLDVYGLNRNKKETCKYRQDIRNINMKLKKEKETERTRGEE